MLLHHDIAGSVGVDSIIVGGIGGVSTICGGVTLCFSSGNTGVVICSVGVAGLKAGRLTLSVGNAGKIIDSSRLQALSRQSKGFRCISDVWKTGTP